jgi:hypothetical protein
MVKSIIYIYIYYMENKREKKYKTKKYKTKKYKTKKYKTKNIKIKYKNKNYKTKKKNRGGTKLHVVVLCASTRSIFTKLWKKILSDCGFDKNKYIPIFIGINFIKIPNLDSIFGWSYNKIFPLQETSGFKTLAINHFIENFYLVEGIIFENCPNYEGEHLDKRHEYISTFNGLLEKLNLKNSGTFIITTSHYTRLTGMPRQNNIIQEWLNSKDIDITPKNTDEYTYYTLGSPIIAQTHAIVASSL